MQQLWWIAQQRNMLNILLKIITAATRPTAPITLNFKLNTSLVASGHTITVMTQTRALSDRCPRNKAQEVLQYHSSCEETGASSPHFNPSCQLDEPQPSHSPPAGLQPLRKAVQLLVQGHKYNMTPNQRTQEHPGPFSLGTQLMISSFPQQWLGIFLRFQNSFHITHSRRAEDAKMQHCKFHLRKQLYCHGLTKCLCACRSCSVCLVLCLSHTACHWDSRT